MQRKKITSEVLVAKKTFSQGSLGSHDAAGPCDGIAGRKRNPFFQARASTDKSGSNSNELGAAQKLLSSF